MSSKFTNIALARRDREMSGSYMTLIRAIFSPERLKVYAIASLASQIMIVVTGGLVRLTGSGLGCPTWPRCTEDSFVTVPEMGWHGIIEFGNRLLTFVLVIIALLTFIVVRRTSKSLRFGLTWPALLLGLGIIAQALLGGLTVLTGLNSWVVGAHFLLSGVLISIAAVLTWRVYSPEHSPISYWAVNLSWPIFVVGWAAVVVGVVVTGAGPHAGDAATPRNGFDLEVWQHYHSYPAYLMTLLIAVAFFLTAASLQSSRLSNPAYISLGSLLLVSVMQAILGVVQSNLGVPALMAGAHMFGAAVIIAFLTFQLLALRSRYQRFGRN
ncbi:MAG: heme A synthase [Actinobacteria bacterium]|nr:heme A synthase [Actinomycetota bacterium]